MIGNGFLGEQFMQSSNNPAGILNSRQEITKPYRNSQIHPGKRKGLREFRKPGGKSFFLTGDRKTFRESLIPFGNPQNLSGFLFSLQESTFPFGKGPLLPEFGSFQADFPSSQTAFDLLQVEFNMKAACNDTISTCYGIKTTECMSFQTDFGSFQSCNDPVSTTSVHFRHATVNSLVSKTFLKNMYLYCGKNQRSS